LPLDGTDSLRPGVLVPAQVSGLAEVTGDWRAEPKRGLPVVVEKVADVGVVGPVD
jgi:hypothetical protein